MSLHMWLYTRSSFVREYGNSILLGLMVGMLLSLI